MRCHMWKSKLELDKYEYLKTNPHTIRFFGVFGIVATVLMTYGLWQFLQLHIIYLIVFGPIVAIFAINKLLHYIVLLFYQRMDSKKHEKFIHTFWEIHKEPSVSIFLPWAGEDLDMHEEVVKAATQLNYHNYKVYMLDDVGSKEHEAIAQKYNCVYLSRPNKGEFKKSGNLEYGYKNSDSEFIFILDADFIPIKDALYDLVPYIASDKEIGILQTPQYFEQTKAIHKNSKIEFGGGNIVEDFYKIVMPCRDEFKAAMCVGTSAIYRRETLEKLDGTPKVQASEDLATGLIITQFGYYVKYLPLIVSMGKSPDNYQAYFKQHLRWCSGNVVFANYWPKAKLNLMARIIYTINPMYYLSEALSVVFTFQFLILLYFHGDTLSIYHMFYFLPYVALSRGIMPMYKSNKNKMGTKLAALNNIYTYFYTYIRLFTKGVPAWHPTGVKVTGLHKDFSQAMNVGLIISALYIVLFMYVIISRPAVFGNYNAYIVLAWAFYAVFWQAVYFYHVSKYMHPIRLASAQSFVEKASIYTRTHLTFVLTFALVGIAAFNSIISLQDPTSPTIVAIASLQHTPETKVIAEAKQAPDKAVLGTKIHKEPVTEYSFTFKKSDTSPSIVHDAIAKFAADNEIALTQEQIDYATKLLLAESGVHRQLTIGEEITIEVEQMVKALTTTIDKGI